MSFRCAVFMDPIEQIKPYKDSTFAMLLEAQRRNYELIYLTRDAVALQGVDLYVRARAITVRDEQQAWFELGPSQPFAHLEFDLALLRCDPPVHEAFLHDTLVFERMERAGTLVVNSPRALRDCNEKLYALDFPQCTPAGLITRDEALLKAFVREHEVAVGKVLDGMAGVSVFKMRADDPNLNVIVETLTNEGKQMAMVQRYLPEAVFGDKRIILIDGDPVPFALARIPKSGEFRGNMARGGRAEAVPLSERDRWICAQLKPDLQRRGLHFVGIDVIGDYLTEINVTSPTGIRELDQQCALNIAGLLFDSLERKLAAR